MIMQFSGEGFWEGILRLRSHNTAVIVSTIIIAICFPSSTGAVYFVNTYCKGITIDCCLRVSNLVKLAIFLKFVATC